MNPGDSNSHTVINAVAEREEVHPSELRFPLFEAINPDSLDTLFRSTIGHLTFEYHGYRVTVTHDGDVDVEPIGGE